MADLGVVLSSPLPPVHGGGALCSIPKLGSSWLSRGAEGRSTLATLLGACRLQEPKAL